MNDPTSSSRVDSILRACDFPTSGARVTCAVSGGADSLALLVLARRLGLDVEAVHVDHGLRPGSAAEAGAVADACRHLGATFRAVSVKIAAGPNLEARAREARYAALPADVLTGHTADDRAETVVLNLLRGAGVDGLAGLRPVGGPSGRVRHPLLALRRADTEWVCHEAGLIPLQDPSNTDVALLRNRVRHEILPALSAAAGRDLVPVLVRQADLMADDADLLDDLAGRLDPTDARAIAVAPLPLARRAVRRWLTGEHPPDAATVERVLAVARGEAVACELPGGDRVSRRNQRLSRNGPSEQD
jgi:tRNA(Ile)-lysidine synthase